MTLVLLVGHNFCELDTNVLGILWLTTKSGESVGSSLEITLLDEVSGGVWEEEETTTKDDGPEELNRNGNSVCARIGTVFGGIDDHGGEQNTDGDAELVSSDKSATDFARALQKLVQSRIEI